MNANQLTKIPLEKLSDTLKFLIAENEIPLSDAFKQVIDDVDAVCKKLLRDEPAPAQPVIPEQPELVMKHSSVIAEQLAHVLSGMDVNSHNAHQRAVISCAIYKLNKTAEILQQKPTALIAPERLDYQSAKELFNYLMNEEETNATVNGWNACLAEMLKAQPVSEQPVSEPYKLPVGYFSYGTEHGFNWHQTAKQATDDAEAMIDDYRGDACDGWSEETDNVCWGVILQQAGKVNERPRTDDNDNIAPHIDTVCDYALLPAQESE